MGALRFARPPARVAATRHVGKFAMEEQAAETGGRRRRLERSDAGRLARPARMARAGGSNGQLKRIDKPVDPDEELAAIAYLATRREDAPALMFEKLEGDRPARSILANMLGASKERYALAVGLDPSLSTAEMIAATPRDHAAAHQARARAKDQARRSTRSCCATTKSTSRNFRCRNSGRATAAAISAPATSP